MVPPEWHPGAGGAVVERPLDLWGPVWCHRPVIGAGRQRLRAGPRMALRTRPRRENVRTRDDGMCSESACPDDDLSEIQFRIDIGHVNADARPDTTHTMGACMQRRYSTHNDAFHIDVPQTGCTRWSSMFGAAGASDLPSPFRAAAFRPSSRPWCASTPIPSVGITSVGRLFGMDLG